MDHVSRVVSRGPCIPCTPPTRPLEGSAPVALLELPSERVHGADGGENFLSDGAGGGVGVQLPPSELQHQLQGVTPGVTQGLQ